MAKKIQGHITEIQQFILSVFCSLISAFAAVILSCGSPFSLSITVTMLLMSGCIILLASEYIMQKYPEDKISYTEQDEEDKSSKLFYISILGFELSRIIDRDKTIKSFLSEIWWMPLFLAGGIMCMHVLCYSAIKIARLLHRPVHNTEKAEESLLQCIIKIIALIPQTLVSALCSSSDLMMMWSSPAFWSLGFAWHGPWIICGLFLVLTVALLYLSLYSHQVDSNNPFYFRGMVFAMVQGLTVSFVSSLLMIHKEYFIAHPMILLAGVSFLLWSAIGYMCASFCASSDKIQVHTQQLPLETCVQPEHSVALCQKSKKKKQKKRQQKKIHPQSMRENSDSSITTAESVSSDENISATHPRHMFALTYADVVKGYGSKEEHSAIGSMMHFNI